MADGTKSSEVEVSGKKKRAQRTDKKSAKKRGSAVGGKDRSKSAQKKKSGAKSKQSEDDLDIESEQEEASASVQESD